MSEDKTNVEEVTPEAVEEVKEEPAPKKRRRRKKKAEPKLIEAVSTDTEILGLKTDVGIDEAAFDPKPAEEPAEEEVVETPAPAPKKQRLQVRSQTKVKFEQVKSEKPAHIHKYLGKSPRY